MKKMYFLFVFSTIFNVAFGQVGIGTTNPDTSSILDVTSTSKGVLIPRMTRSQKNAISAPTNGLLVFQTDTLPGFYFYNDTQWEKLTNDSSFPIDHDFYKEGTSNVPTSIDDDLYTMGNLAIGKTTADHPLDIAETDGTRAFNTSISGNTAGPIYGHYISNTNTGIGEHYGLYTALSGESPGKQCGLRNIISNTMDNEHYGVLNTLSGNGSGKHYGLYNIISGSGTGDQCAVYNNIAHEGNVTGVYGVCNIFSGPSLATTRTGNYTSFVGGGQGDQVGNRIDMACNNSNSQVGNMVFLGGSSDNEQIGNYIKIYNSGDGLHTGSEIELNGDGNGHHIGLLLKLPGGGTGNRVGVESSVIPGSGNNIGLYTDIFDAVGSGTNYGIYSTVTGTGHYAGYFDGDVYISGTVTKASDRRLKEKIVNSGLVLNKIKQIVVSDYFFKAEEAEKYGFPKSKQTGFIAQELESVFPNLVKDTPLLKSNDTSDKEVDRYVKSINYIGFIPYLTKAIQEQQEIINTQEQKIYHLEARLERIEKLLKK